MPLSARVWLGMTALALSFFVRVDADASTQGAEIRGIVFQGGTDSVLPGVRVTCEGCSSVTTNRDGVFLLRGLKTGAYVITLSHDGQRWTSPEITTASGHSTELLVTLPEAEGVPAQAGRMWSGRPALPRSCSARRRGRRRDPRGHGSRRGRRRERQAATLARRM